MNDHDAHDPSSPSGVFLTDAELARRRRQSVRSLQRQRRARQAPPSVKVGRNNLTRLDWLLEHEAAELAKAEDGR